MTIDFKWFDEKYKNQGKPSLEDRAELIKRLDIPLTDRAKGKILDTLKQALHRFGQNGAYSPALHTLTYELLVSFSPLTDIDRNEYAGYVKKYKDALKKHETQIELRCNFE
jgi:hypothetical protein